MRASEEQRRKTSDAKVGVWEKGEKNKQGRELQSNRERPQRPRRRKLVVRVGP